MEFEWMEDLLEECEAFLSSLFEQGLHSAGSRENEAAELEKRFREAGLLKGGEQLHALREDFRKSRLDQSWDGGNAAKVYCHLWSYVKLCRKGLELARAEALLEPGLE